MLHTNKLAQSDPIKTLIAFVILAIFAAIVIFGVVKPGGEKAAGIVALGPSTDEICIARSRLITGEKVDIDMDGRDDYLCDSCVCAKGCHNDNDDSDKDKLPDICDAVDNDKTKYGFDKTQCPENSLINLGGAWKYQCRPSVTAPAPQPPAQPQPAGLT